MSDTSQKPTLITQALQFASSLADEIYKNCELSEGAIIGFTGTGPYFKDDLKSLLPEHIQVAELDGVSDPNQNVRMIVIGREDFDEAALEDHVQLSEQGIVFLPQEGFLDLVLFGYNWWVEEIDELNSVLEYHEGIQFLHSLQNQAFTWPGTSANESDGTRIGDVEFAEESDLRRLGYSIRTERGSPTTRTDRWRVLERAVRSDQIGLQPTAEHIANLVRLRKTQPGGSERYHYAIQEWEYDLARLKRTYFSTRNYTFSWPSTEF